MKKILIIVLMVVTNMSFAQEITNVETYRCEVEITGFRNYDGNVLVQVFNDQKEVLKSLVVNFTDKRCTFTVDDLPQGKYAIRYFHDENNNQKMDTNFVGIPKEGYGFSNNATSYFGPPSFSEWLFDMNANKKMNLEISYLF